MELWYNKMNSKYVKLFTVWIAALSLSLYIINMGQIVGQIGSSFLKLIVLVSKMTKTEK